MSIFTNPFTSHWLIYLPPRLKSTIILHKKVVFVSHESYCIIYVPILLLPVFLIEARCVLCEVRIDRNADSPFFGGQHLK
jgi:hypothetical protein